MKRTLRSTLLASILLLACVLSLASCAKTPANMYQASVDKIEAAGGVDATITATVDVVVSSYSVKSTVVADVKTNGDDVYVKTSTTSMGQTVTDEATFANGTLYVNSGSLGKRKTTCSLDQFNNYYGDSTEVLSEDITADSFKNATVTTESGVTTVTLVMNEAEIQKLIDDAIGNLGLTSSNGVTVTEASQNLIFKNGLLSEQTVYIDITMNAPELGGSMTLKNQTKIVFNNIGTAPVIEAPQDADSYIQSDILG